jgi:low affinity Fe/Cu permease
MTTKSAGQRSFFTRFTNAVSRLAGRPVAFVAAFTIVVAWAVSGPVFGFSETWQLVINTGTTIITFLMVFIIQASQNRDTAALHLKLDELVRVTRGAHNALLNIDTIDETHLERLRKLYLHLGEAAAHEADIVEEMKKGIKGDEDAERSGRAPAKAA